MALEATYLGSSGWVINFGSTRVLIDPWLTGTLKFPPGSWLIEGSLEKDLDVPSGINMVLLTQGLADHAHLPSLELLNRSIPVIGSSSAFKVVKSLGFKSVFKLNPGDQKIINGISIQATAGAPVPNTENGYLISSGHGSIYIEPHGFLDPSLPFCEVDAVFTPVINLSLPIAGNFIAGKNVLPQLISRFKPLSILSTTTGGDAKFKGLLPRLIQVDGSTEIASEIIGKEISFINSIPHEKYSLKVRSN